MKDKVKFSIVVPTRNRAEYLKYTLLTCINQTYDNFEIIISDNCSEDNTEQIVKSLNSDKIKYFKTESPLAMTLNYQFAMTKVTGDYCIFLGSDDGLCLFALELLNEIIKETHFPIINWKANDYIWNDAAEPGYGKGYLRTQPITASCFVNGEEQIRKIANYSVEAIEMDYPSVYDKCVVSMELVKKMEEKGIKLFDTIIPDCYSGIALMTEEKYYFKLGIPLSIAGAGATSNGRYTGREVKDGRYNSVKDFDKLNCQLDSNYSVFWGNIRRTVFAWDEVFLGIKSKYPNMLDSSIEINYKNMLRKALDDELYFVRVFKRNHKEVGDFIEALEQVVKTNKPYCDDKDLQEWFENNIKIYSTDSAYRLEMEKCVLKEGVASNGEAIWENENWALDNIYDASQLISKIYHFDTERIKCFSEKLKRCVEIVDFIVKSNFKKIGIYGAGKHGEMLYKWIFPLLGDKVAYCACDSNEKLCGTLLADKVKIENLNNFIEEKPDCVIIASNPNQETIKARLLKEKAFKEKEIQVLELYQIGDMNYFDIML